MIGDMGLKTHVTGKCRIFLVLHQIQKREDLHGLTRDELTWSL